ncbi:MAG: T9SS type A sorting domain-containing protein [Saprospiraceae bacterium]|nr:T9SS type A sorting domain-containing protein [Saprospiraceae bacterium]
MQIKFCGKTTNVVPSTDGSGNDQRHKGALRLDYIRVGRLGQSKTSPFYNLGNTGGLTFKNNTWVDGCTNNQNQTYCSGCTKCTFVTDNSNKTLGVFEGKMAGNVRTRSNNNDLFLESTGDQNVVCFVTDPFSVAGHEGKRVEVNIGYEGTKQDGFETKNVNFWYKFTNGEWKQQLNQNSNFLRVIDTTILVLDAVPTAVENLERTVAFQLMPNPVNTELEILLNSNETFFGTVNILDFESRTLKTESHQIPTGTSKLAINVKDLSAGFYFFQLSDGKGRTSSKKFAKY